MKTTMQMLSPMLNANRSIPFSSSLPGKSADTNTYPGTNRTSINHRTALSGASLRGGTIMNTAEITTKTTIAKRSLNSAICCHLDLIELNLFHRQEDRAKDLAKEKVASFTGLFSQP